MDEIMNWIKNFLVLYFFLILVVYLLPKESYRKYLRSAVKMILLLVLFLPMLRLFDEDADIFGILEEIGDYRQDEGWNETKRWEELQDEYIKERSVYYQEHFGESESSADSGIAGSADTDSGHALERTGEASD